MTAPTTLLDRSFLLALAGREHPWHDVAADAYRELVDRYECNRVILLARDDHLAELQQLRSSMLAPVEVLHVAAQHRHAADEVLAPFDDPDLAVTLVLLRREKICSIATFDRRFAAVDVDVVPLDARGSGADGAQHLIGG